MFDLSNKIDYYRNTYINKKKMFSTQENIINYLKEKRIHLYNILILHSYAKINLILINKNN